MWVTNRISCRHFNESTAHSSSRKSALRCVHCIRTHLASSWAAWYNAWLLIKLMPKGAGVGDFFSFSFLFFSFLFFSFLFFSFLFFCFLFFSFLLFSSAAAVHCYIYTQLCILDCTRGFGGLGKLLRRTWWLRQPPLASPVRCAFPFVWVCVHGYMFMCLYLHLLSHWFAPMSLCDPHVAILACMHSVTCSAIPSLQCELHQILHICS